MIDDDDVQHEAALFIDMIVVPEISEIV